MARVTVFHTSDMHNKLTPSLADRLRALKESSPESLMLDSGDGIWAGNVFWRPGGELVLDLMNSVPYDAMCMGNREFHFLEAGMRAKISRARFPVLSANLRKVKRNASGPESAGFAEIHAGGARVIIFGLTIPCITERMLVRRVSHYYFVHPIAAAAEIVPRLRTQCDLLIALTHIGIKADRELAAAVRGIDVILGGHTHIILNGPEWVSGTCILHHGSHAHYAGRVGIEIGSGRPNVTSELIPLAKA